MPSGSTIVSITASLIWSSLSEAGSPAVEATVNAESGAVGVAICTAGVSVGRHEVEFAYDGGRSGAAKASSARWTASTT